MEQHESFPVSSTFVGKRIQYLLPGAGGVWSAGTVTIKHDDKPRGRFEVDMDGAPTAIELDFPMSKLGIDWPASGVGKAKSAFVPSGVVGPDALPMSSPSMNPRTSVQPLLCCSMATPVTRTAWEKSYMAPLPTPRL